MDTLELNNENFEKEVLENEQLVLVNFWRPGCGPCFKMEPIIEEVAKELEGKAKIGKLNVLRPRKSPRNTEFRQLPLLSFSRAENRSRERLDCAPKKF